MATIGAWQPGQSGNPAGRPKGPSKNLLSKAYKAILGNPLDEDLRQELGLPEGCTWADAIGYNVVKRALGKVPDEKICFRAITELRETTEGKTPEKVIAAGTNEELTALARIMQGEPAKPDGEEEDDVTERSEADFHADDSHKE